ncbi:MAG: hypothetical protein EBX52_11060, partial [Proteobacteria bacterium]|nr:hypothetical protein [Pseudomonadota bacterium]
PEEQGGLPSETHFEPIESRTGSSGVFTLMACFPRTGRQHQIRVHAECAGYPLVGDKVYGLSDDEVLALLDGARDHERSLVSPTPVEEPSEEVIAEDEDLASAPLEEGDGLGPEEEDESAGGADFGEARAAANPDSSSRFEIPGPTSTSYAEAGAKLLIARHALHAAGLRFKHPVTGAPMVFESDLPKDLREFFEGLDGAPLKPFRTKHW